MLNYVWILIAVCLVFLILYLIIRRNRDSMLLNRKRSIIERPLSEKFSTLNERIGPLGFAYEANQDIFYSVTDGWQRQFGYCRLYDEAAAPFNMIIDCEPIYFEYQGREWLIEFWKGQYGMTTGAEVGVYVSDGQVLDIPGIFKGTFYESVKDEENLLISISLWKNEKHLFTRREMHWWLTGFVLGEFSYPSDLTMAIEITFKTMGMCLAFLEGLKNTGYGRNEIRVYNNTVRILFTKPHSAQPLSRTRWLTFIKQGSNKRYCRIYHKLTKDMENTLDKIELIFSYSPRIYNRIMRLGKTKEIYEGYEAIKKKLK